MFTQLQQWIYTPSSYVQSSHPYPTTQIESAFRVLARVPPFFKKQLCARWGYDVSRSFKPWIDDVYSRMWKAIEIGENDAEVCADIVRSILPPIPKLLASYTKGRISSRITDMMPMVRGCRIASYLDIGCGNGHLTGALGKALGLRACHGCDIHLHDNDVLDTSICEVDKIGASASALPFANRVFDLVTCIMSLHHIEELDEALDEITRVVRVGGWVLIREHDCRDMYFATFLDLIHLFYTHIFVDHDEYETDVHMYRSHRGWKTKLRRKGLYEVQWIPTHDLYRSYYALYQRRF